MCGMNCDQPGSVREGYVYGNGVSLIEWADLIADILPEHYTKITIEKDLEQGFDYRRISICEY